jgi:WD40 repeat protein
VYGVSFSPDGKYVISGGGLSAQVWDAKTGLEVSRMTHDYVIISVTFSPDGKYAASGDDKTARVWEVMTGREVARITHDNLVNSIAFSPDGRHVASSGYDKTTRVWLYHPEDLVDNSCARVVRNLNRDEWKLYIGDALPYQAVCLNLPIEPETTVTPTP